jgi:hypothetical protein
MNDETTNPDAPSLRSVYGAIKDMREENREDHKAITTKLERHSVQLACLETKWKFLKWLIPATVGVIGAVVAVNSLL